MKSFLMTPGNAQKCHGGTKVQTRRLIKPQPDEWYSHILVGNYHPTMVDKKGEEYPGEEIFGAYTEDGEWGWECPYSIGEKVYIKEKYCHKVDPITAVTSDSEFWYFAVNPEVIKVNGDGAMELTKAGYQASPWLSSMFMPEWAARTIVEITDIRCQRIQDISEKDAIAEGAGPGYILASPTIFHKGQPEYKETPMDYRGGFQRLWDSIHGEGAWERNEWVFAYSFRRME